MNNILNLINRINDNYFVKILLHTYLTALFKVIEILYLSLSKCQILNLYYLMNLQIVILKALTYWKIKSFKFYIWIFFIKKTSFLRKKGETLSVLFFMLHLEKPKESIFTEEKSLLLSLEISHLLQIFKIW